MGMSLGWTMGIPCLGLRGLDLMRNRVLYACDFTELDLVVRGKRWMGRVKLVEIHQALSLTQARLLSARFSRTLT